MASPDMSPTESGTARTSDAGSDVQDWFEAVTGPMEAAPPEQYPTRLAKAAAQVLQMDGVGIQVLLEGQNRVPLAASSNQAAAAEQMEFTLGEGPCLYAHEVNRPVLVPDLTDESSYVWSQWPQYAEAVLKYSPYRAVFGLPLSSGDLSLGTVCMFRKQPGELSITEMGNALAVKTRIFYDLLATGTFGDSEPAFRWLNLPLARARGVVWQALGMAAVEIGVDAPDALTLFRWYSYTHDRLLDDVAADIIARRIPLDEFQN